MHSFKAGLINELYLLVYRRKTVVFLAVSLVLPIILAVTLQTLKPYLGLIAVSQSFPIDMLGLYTMLWIPLFIFMTTADLFPNEIASNTLKLSLLRPTTKLKVYMAKMTALLISIGAILLVLGLVTSVCSLFVQEPGSINVMDIVKTYAAAWLSMTALSALFGFIVQFFQTAGSAFAFSVVFYAAAKIAPFFVRAVSAVSPVSYTDWQTLWLSSSVSAGKLMVVSLFLLSSCILFFTLGYFIFNRKEV